MASNASFVHFAMLSAVCRSFSHVAGFFAGSDDSDDSDDEGEEDEAEKDELEAYLALPQLKFKSEQGALDWWREHAKEFPNLAVMARQYLGCPATSATVERLFSQVGIAFAEKRKRQQALTLQDIMFARINLP